MLADQRKFQANSQTFHKLVSDLDSGVDMHSNVSPSSSLTINSSSSCHFSDTDSKAANQIEASHKPLVDEDAETPRAVPVILTDEELHSFTLVDDALSSILLRDDVADLKVCIVSVAGAFRKGKSFLLNFFLRYLSHNQNLKIADQWQTKGVDDWLGADDQSLRGFRWRGGSERETSGMLLWSEPFFGYLPSGEKVAILLMDTQGAFDSQSTVKDCATVFALSTMVSSVQIYNLSQNIQEDDLQHLQLFTEYGRLALESADAKPFQNLIFLVRDWSFPYEADYGFEGGRNILDRRLQVSDKQHAELQQLRKHIKNCFTDIECFLMPHPGLKVATSPHFKGQLSDVEPEFKMQLKSLIPNVVGFPKLTLKEINGESVTCRELLEYFRSYIKIFQGEELPEPKSMLLATAEANNLVAVASARANYCKKMEEICGGETAYVAADELEAKHDQFREESLTQFSKTRKMGGEEFSRAFLEKLDLELNERYENFVKVNNGKNFFRSARTPAVFFVLLVVDYLFQEIFQLFYLDFLATLCGTLLGLILFTMSLWFYSRYTGNLRDIGQSIDELANFIWEEVLSPFSTYALQEGVKHAAGLQRKFNDTASANGSATNLHRSRSARKR